MAIHAVKYISNDLAQIVHLQRLQIGANSVNNLYNYALAGE